MMTSLYEMYSIDQGSEALLCQLEAYQALGSAEQHSRKDSRLMCKQELVTCTGDGARPQHCRLSLTL